MGIFNRKRRHGKASDIEKVRADTNDKIEVEVEREATENSVKKAKEVNQKLNNLLKENGFTIKIYLASGGKHKGNNI